MTRYDPPAGEPGPAQVNRMEDSKPDSFFLRSTSALSLHDRFSQLTQSRMVTFDPALLQQKRASAPPPLVLLVNSETPSPPYLRIQDSSLKGRRRLRRRRRSIWTRLGWQQLTRRLPASKPPRGFWSFKNKYRWRARSTSTCTCRRRSQLSPHLQRGGAIAYRGRGPRKPVPTKKQLDAQLDDYMSLSKSRLDAELEEYMSMAGQTQWD